MKRTLLILLAALGVIDLTGCDTQLKLGNARIQVPSGWREIARDNERVNVLSPDERQQATISLMRFAVSPTFDDFKAICTARLDAERADAPTVSLNAEQPFEDAGIYGMFFSGKEGQSDRLFSGYISANGKEVITIYIESIGVDPKDHRQTFEAFVRGLKRH